MTIAGKYSFNDGEDYVKKYFNKLLKEVIQVIKNVDAEKYKTKISKEKTMTGKLLYNPKELNKAFKKEFKKFGWNNQKVKCDYPTQFYTNNYKPRSTTRGAFRDMDFLKDKLGIEVQFGKYAFMVYNVCAKMTIFNKLGFISAGIEIVPIKQFANEMSTGVSYFEQFIWDLEQRGISNIDIPVLVYGIDI